MRKKEQLEQSEQGKRLQNVLDDLNKELSMTEMASKIDKKVTIQIDASKLYQFCNKYKSLSDEVINAFHECFNVNPLYIKGRSESMYDDMKVECEFFKKLVEAFSVEKRYYLDSDEQELYEDFLVLKIKHDFYNFLIEVANLQTLKKQDEKRYHEELNKIFVKYNKLKEENKLKKEKDISYGKYALLPEDYLLEIADDEEESHYELNPQRYKIHNIPRCDNSSHKG